MGCRRSLPKTPGESFKYRKHAALGWQHLRRATIYDYLLHYRRIEHCYIPTESTRPPSTEYVPPGEILAVKLVRLVEEYLALES